MSAVAEVRSRATAIRYHHSPEQHDGPHRNVVEIVTMANFLCALHGRTALGVRNVPEPPESVLDGLGFRPDEIPAFREQLDEALAQAAVVAEV